jgi:hypothetical protein
MIGTPLLNSKHEMFCALYIREPNAKKAYIEAFQTTSRTAVSQAHKLLKTPKIIRRINELMASISEAVVKDGITTVEGRVASLSDRHRRMEDIIKDRAEKMPLDEKYGHIPGAATGLLTNNYKGVDVALLQEMRATEQQAAQELGQWKTERRDDGAQPVVQIVFVAPQVTSAPQPERREIAAPAIETEVIQ